MIARVEMSREQEIVRILEEMMEDLRKREDMFASMLAKAQSQLSENGAKYDEWQGKLSKVASEIDESRRIISQEVPPLCRITLC